MIRNILVEFFQFLFLVYQRHFCGDAVRSAGVYLCFVGSSLVLLFSREQWCFFSFVAGDIAIAKDLPSCDQFTESRQIGATFLHIGFCAKGEIRRIAT